LSYQDGEPKGLDASAMGSGASQSQAAVAQTETAGEASGVAGQNGEPDTSGPQAAELADAPSDASNASGLSAAGGGEINGEEATGEHASDISSSPAVGEEPDTLETSASGDGQADEGETSAEEVAAEVVAVEVADATETGESQAQGSSEMPDLVARESFAAHLSSVQSEDGTEVEWRTLQNLFPNLLGDRTLTVRTVEVADQGTFYRVMAGPFADFAAAEDFCAQLNASDQYCVVRRLDQ